MIDEKRNPARPQIEEDPPYEAEQGMHDLPVGGTTDDHSDLTMDTSGAVQRPVEQQEHQEDHG